MLGFAPGARVYLALGSTDMRKSIDGLSLLVGSQLDRDALSGNVFVFCNRSRTILKALYWDHNGFALWHKRLEQDRFRWPKTAQDVLEVSPRQLQWLLSGLEVEQSRSHKELRYSCTY